MQRQVAPENRKRGGRDRMANIRAQIVFSKAFPSKKYDLINHGAYDL